MASVPRCPRCGSTLASSASAGTYCPVCLLSAAVGDDRGRHKADSLGLYRIVRTLGEGGMGAVYLAEQDHPIRRLVALKVIKLGMDTRDVVARFNSEREALALMDHPHIARVLDAGASADGRPYFVMEYVPGLPITDFCDRHQLPTAARLRLMRQVCAAVQHAHQRGIIHRDLKPSNVLVTMEDGEPFPKVIDFGVAKAIEQDVLVHTLFTEQGRLVGTPEYMSPEQALLGAAPLSTQTDVYSLGVMLYELLVGALPFESAMFRTAGYDEMRRIIREVDPPKPSTRIGTLGARAEEAASRRQTRPDALQRHLRGDLDWITLKALEKDPGRRYASVSEFGADIARHLQNEPVAAGPPGAAYRVRTFVRRHRVAVGVASVVALLLVSATTLSTWLFMQAETARRTAERRRIQADEARGAAEEQQRLADAARLEAGRQRSIAESESTIADAARAEAERQRDEAERRAYRTNIAAADMSLAAGEGREAQRLLTLSSPRLRGWEWGYLQHSADSSVMTLRAPRIPGLPAPIAAFNAVGFAGNRMRAIGTQETSLSAADAIVEFDMAQMPSRSPSAARVRLEDNSSVLAVSGDGSRLLVSRWHGRQPTARRLTREETSATGRAVELRVNNPSLPDSDRHFVFVVDARSGQTVARFTLADPPGVWLGDQRNDRAISLRSTRFAWWQRCEVFDDTVREAVATVSCPVVVRGALNEDGTRAAIWSWDNTLRVWDVAAGREIATLAGHRDFISQAVFVSASDRLISGSNDGTVRIWDTSLARATSVLGPLPAGVTAVAVDRSGDIVAAGLINGLIRLWRGAALVPESLGRPGAGPGAITSLAFDRGAQRLVSSSIDRTVRLWDPSRMLELRTLRGHDETVTGVAWSPDDRLIASSSIDGTIRLWDATAPLAAISEKGRQVLGLGFIENGSALATGHNDDVVRVWDLTTGTLARQATLPGELGSMAVAGGRIAVGLVNQVTRNRPKPDVSALVLDSRTLRPLATLTGQDGTIGGVALDGNGTRMATTSGNGVWLWDVSARRAIHRWSGGWEGLAVSLSDDGTAMVAGYRAARGGGLLLWPARATDPHTPSAMTIDNSTAPAAVAFTPDRRHAVSGGSDGVIRIWDAQSGRLVASLKGHDAAVQALAFSPDGRRIVSGGSDRTLRIWDADSHELLLTFRVNAPVQRVAFSNDGMRLAAGSIDGTIHVWYARPLRP